MVLIDSFASGVFSFLNNTKKSRVENHYNVQISTSLLCEKKRKGFSLLRKIPYFGNQ